MLEGGGQILRNTAAFAAILGIDVRIENIRANRDNPGLRPQHLTGLQMIEKASNGKLIGAEVKSCTITLRPGIVRCNQLVGDTKTAGSCVLLAQATLPCFLFAEGGSSQSESTSLLTFLGGTDAKMAPPVGYMQHILLPLLKQAMGISIELDVVRRGFFPRGGGKIVLKVPALPFGETLPPINLMERGEISRVAILAFTAGRVNPNVGNRMAKSAENLLGAYLDAKIPIDSKVDREPPDSDNGCGVLVVVETSTGCIFGGSGLGERGLAAEIVGRNAAESVISTLSEYPAACVDDWMQDQLIIFMALAHGTSSVRTGKPTLHTRTAIAVAESLTSVRFHVEKDVSGKAWIISCTGLGQQGRSHSDSPSTSISL